MSARTASPHVVIYTRERCGLCREAEALVRDLVPESQITMRDVDEDDELLRQYHLRVPVIEIDGKLVAEAPIDTELVRSMLGRRGRRWFGRSPRGS